MESNSKALAKFRRDVRRALADYISSEGCGCCQNVEAHRKHSAALGKLLRVKPFGDGSGFDFSRYRTSK